MPEDRARVETPPAEVRHKILSTLQTVAEECEDTGKHRNYWSIAGDKCNLPKRMLQRLAQPNEQVKLDKWLSSTEAGRAKEHCGGKRRWWK
jgi:hypothetical protein